MITALTAKGRAFLENNEILQKLYLDLIKECLQAELSSSPSVADSESDSFCTGHLDRHNCVYQLLSFMNPTCEMPELSDLLDGLFEDLIRRASPDELHQHLDKGKLYLCLLGRSTTFLIDKFCGIENRLRFQFSIQTDLAACPCGYLDQPQFVGPSAQICYSQSFVKDRTLAWQQLFFHSLDGNHILEKIVVSTEANY